MASPLNPKLFTIIDPESFYNQDRFSSHPHKRKLYQFNPPTTEHHDFGLLANSPAEGQEFEKFASGQSHELTKNGLGKQQHHLTRSLTSAKKKQKQSLNPETLCEQNIFKYPSSILSTNLTNNSVRLPALAKKSTICDQLADLSSTRRKKIKIPMQKLKPLPVDEVKRRFMEKYRKELIKM